MGFAGAIQLIDLIAKLPHTTEHVEAAMRTGK
jgi:hypothetical protein